MEEALRGLSKFEGDELKAKVAELTQNIIGEQPKVESIAPLGLCEPLVLCGPVVGKVTDTTAVVLLELDEAGQVECVATSADGHSVSQKRLLPGKAARAFQLEGMKPDTAYTYTFNGLNLSQKKEIDALRCSIKTFKSAVDIKEVTVLVQSCDRPDRLLPQDTNPWTVLDDKCKKGECDILLHLGDQVYTKMKGFLERACMVMDLYDDPATSAATRKKMIAEAEEELRRAYRFTWGLPATRSVMAQSSHLMLWSDNDVANDFTEATKKGSNEQKYSDQFIQSAMGVYTEYQRQLWDPKCEGQLPADKSARMEEWNFHTYGGLGIFMVDMRGNRITAGGVMQKGDLMSAKQKKALEDAFATPGLSCMLVASEIPFVSESPEMVQKSAQFITFLEGHWAYKEDECTWLYDLCFDWKAGAEGREVVLLGGDIHTGVMTDLKCNKTNSVIKSVTASPITNHVCGFFCVKEGRFNDRYNWSHTHYPNMRNFCKIKAKFEDGKCSSLDVEMELIPASKSDEQKCDSVQGCIKKYRKNEAPTAEDDKELIEHIGKLFPPKT